MDQTNELLCFLRRLNEVRIFYDLIRKMSGVLVYITVPGQRWEVDFTEDHRIIVEKFHTTVILTDETELDILFRDFASPEQRVVPSAPAAISGQLRSKTMDDYEKLHYFLNQLEDAKIGYRLARIRDSIMMEISVPNERWEVEFMEDRSIIVERFVSTGARYGESELDILFRDFSD